MIAGVEKNAPEAAGGAATRPGISSKGDSPSYLIKSASRSPHNKLPKSVARAAAYTLSNFPAHLILAISCECAWMAANGNRGRDHLITPLIPSRLFSSQIKSLTLIVCERS